ncbi:small peptidoglycan-associated lipoprotein [Cytobacillus suaedae]|nr:small peptidoglycan-associated lipoprotein [Cytobacillus suaedae]
MSINLERSGPSYMRSLVVFMLSFLLLSSCHLAHNTPSSLIFNNAEKQLLFFSDEDNLHNESSYYDALLEIKKTYPEIVTSMKVIPSSEKVRYSSFDVDTFPTLLVIHDNQIIAQIEGDLSKEEIIQPLIDVLK